MPGIVISKTSTVHTSIQAVSPPLVGAAGAAAPWASAAPALPSRARADALEMNRLMPDAPER